MVKEGNKALPVPLPQAKAVFRILETEKRAKGYGVAGEAAALLFQ